jgi:hypothetical protein
LLRWAYDFGGCASPKFHPARKAWGFDTTSLTFGLLIFAQTGAPEHLAAYNRIPNACQATNGHPTAAVIQIQVERFYAARS